MKHKCYKCGNLQDKKWQFCHKCLTNLFNSGIAIEFVNPPRWVGLQKSLLNKIGSKMDPKGEQKFQNIIEAEKIKELRQSSLARAWEEGRKREWKNNKPYWKKNGGRF